MPNNVWKVLPLALPKRKAPSTPLDKLPNPPSQYRTNEGRYKVLEDGSMVKPHKEAVCISQDFSSLEQAQNRSRSRAYEHAKFLEYAHRRRISSKPSDKYWRDLVTESEDAHGLLRISVFDPRRQCSTGFWIEKLEAKVTHDILPKSSKKQKTTTLTISEEPKKQPKKVTDVVTKLPSLKKSYKVYSEPKIFGNFGSAKIAALKKAQALSHTTGLNHRTTGRRESDSTPGIVETKHDDGSLSFMFRDPILGKETFWVKEVKNLDVFILYEQVFSKQNHCAPQGKRLVSLHQRLESAKKVLKQWIDRQGSVINEHWSEAVGVFRPA